MYETMSHYRTYWKAHILIWEVRTTFTCLNLMFCACAAAQYPGYGSCEGVTCEETVNANIREVTALLLSPKLFF